MTLTWAHVAVDLKEQIVETGTSLMELLDYLSREIFIRVVCLVEWTYVIQAVVAYHMEFITVLFLFMVI